MKTCVQVSPTDFRGVVIDGDCKEKPHLTPIVKIVNIWGILSQILLIPVAESLVIRLLPFFREHIPSGRTKGRNSSRLEVCVLFHKAFLSLFPMHLSRL